jgi:two-component system response regulator
MNTTSLPLVLMVEDNQGDAWLFHEALREKTSPVPVRLVVAKTVAEGIQVALGLADSGDLPCLFLMDLHMPREDGRTFLRFLVADQRFAGIPAVMLTSSRREFDRQECLHLGAYAYQVKPNDWTSYLELIDSLQKYWASGHMPTTGQHTNG